MAKKINPFDAVSYGTPTAAKVAESSGVNPFDSAIYSQPIQAPPIKTYKVTEHTPRPTQPAQPTYPSEAAIPAAMPVGQETQSGFVPAVVKAWGQFKYNLMSVFESLTTPMEIKIREDASKTEKIAVDLSGAIYDREKQLATDGIQPLDVSAALALSAVPIIGVELARRYTDVGKEFTKGMLGVKDRIVAAKQEIARKEIEPYQNHWVVEGITGALGSIPQSALMWVPHVGAALFAKSVIQQTFEENMRGEKEVWREALHSTIAAGGEVGAELALGALIGSVKGIKNVFKSGAKEAAEAGTKEAAKKLTNWQIAGLIGKAGMEEGLEGLTSATISSTSYYLIMDNDKPPSLVEILKAGVQEGIGGLMLGGGNMLLRQSVASVLEAQDKKEQKKIDSIASVVMQEIGEQDSSLNTDDDIIAINEAITVENDISGYTSQLRGEILAEMEKSYASNPSPDLAQDIMTLKAKIADEAGFVRANEYAEIDSGVWHRTSSLMGQVIEKAGGKKTALGRAIAFTLNQPVKISEKHSVPRSFVLRNAVANAQDISSGKITVKRVDGKTVTITLRDMDRAFISLVQDAVTGADTLSDISARAFGIIEATIPEPEVQPAEQKPAEAPKAEAPVAQEAEPVAEPDAATPAEEAKPETKVEPKSKVESEVAAKVEPAEAPVKQQKKRTPTKGKVKSPPETPSVSEAQKLGAETTQNLKPDVGVAESSVYANVGSTVTADEKAPAVAEASRQWKAAMKAGKSAAEIDAAFDKLKRAIAKACSELIANDDGGSFYIDGTIAKPRGYAVATPGLGIKAEGQGMSEDAIYEFINKNMEYWREGYLIGPYYSTETDSSYVDVSRVIDPPQKELLADDLFFYMGKEESIYDLKNKKTIPLVPKEVYGLAGFSEVEARQDLYRRGKSVSLYDFDYKTSEVTETRNGKKVTFTRSNIKDFFKSWDANEKTAVDTFIRQTVKNVKIKDARGVMRLGKQPSVEITFAQAWAAVRVIEGYAARMKMTAASFLQKYADVEQRATTKKDVEGASAQVTKASDRFVGAVPLGKIKWDEKRQKYVITLFEQGGIETLAHELGHLFYETMTADQRKAFDSYVGAKDGEWKNVHRERFANGFRAYLSEGKAPNQRMKTIFESFKEWLKGVVASVRSEFYVPLTEEARLLYGKLVDVEAGALRADVTIGAMTGATATVGADGKITYNETPLSIKSKKTSLSWQENGLKAPPPTLVSAVAEEYNIGDAFIEDTSKQGNAFSFIVVGKEGANKYIIAYNGKYGLADKFRLDQAAKFVGQVTPRYATMIFNSHVGMTREVFTKEDALKAIERGDFEAVPKETFSFKFRATLPKKSTKNIMDNYDTIMFRRENASPAMKAEYDIALNDIVAELRKRWDMQKREIKSKYIEIDPTWVARKVEESPIEWGEARVRNLKVIENILSIGVPRSLAEYLNQSEQVFDSPSGFAFIYKQLTNDETFERAATVDDADIEKAIKTGQFVYTTPVDPVTKQPYGTMMDKNEPAVLMAAVMLKLMEARRVGDTKEEARIMATMANSARASGQVIQLFRAFYKQTRKGVAEDVLRFANRGVSKETRQREEAAYKKFMNRMAEINRTLAVEFLKASGEFEGEIDFDTANPEDYDRVVAALLAKKKEGEALTAGEELAQDIAWEAEVRATATADVEEAPVTPEKKKKTPEELAQEAKNKILEVLWPKFLEMFPREAKEFEKPKKQEDNIALLREVVVNRKKYQKAWDAAKAELSEIFEDDPPIQALIEEFYTDKRKLIPIIETKKMTSAVKEIMDKYGLTELDLRRALTAKKKSGEAAALSYIQRLLNLRRNEMAALRPWIKAALKEMQGKRYERMKKPLKPSGQNRIDVKGRAYKTVTSRGGAVEWLSQSIVNEYKRRRAGETRQRDFYKDAGRMILAKLREVDPAEAKHMERLDSEQIVIHVARNFVLYQDLFKGTKHEISMAYKGDKTMMKIMEAVFKYRSSATGRKLATQFDIPNLQKERAARRVMARLGVSANKLRLGIWGASGSTTVRDYLDSLNLDTVGRDHLNAWLLQGAYIVLDKRGEQIKKQIAQALDPKRPQRVGKTMMDRVTEIAATGILDDANVRKYLAQKLGVTMLGEDQIAAINAYVAEIDLLDRNSDTYHDEAMAAKARFMKRIMRNEPASIKEKLLFYRALMMLSGPRTVIKNIFNNISMTPVMMSVSLFESVIADTFMKIADPKGLRLNKIYRVVNPRTALDKSIYGSFAQTFGSEAWRQVKEMFDRDPKDQGKSALSALNTMLAKNHPEVAKQLDEWDKRIIGAIQAEAQNKMEVNINIREVEKLYFGKKPNAADNIAKWWLDLYNRGDTPFAMAWARFYLAQAMVANKTTKLDPAVFEVCINRALQNVWRADVALNHLARQLRHMEFLEKWAKEKEREGQLFLAGTARTIRNIMTVGVTPTMLPFVTTIANLTTIAFHMTFGTITGTAQMIKAIRRVDTETEGIDITQTERFNAGARNFGLGTVGMTSFFGMMALVVAGIATGAAPEDEKERAQWYAEGKQPFSIFLGGKWVSYDWLEPVASPMMLGAMFGDSIRRSRMGWEKNINPLAAIGSMMNSYIGQTIFQGVFDVASDKPSETFTNMLSTLVTGYTPSMARFFAQGIDGYRRNAYNPDAFTAMFYKVVQGVAPVALPKQYDVWGRPIKIQGFTGDKWYNNLLLKMVEPFNSTKDQTDKVSMAVMDVYSDMMSDEDVAHNASIALPGIIKTSIEYNGRTVPLSNAERSELQRVYGQKAYEMVSKLIATQQYKKMPVEKKAAALQKVYTAARKYAIDLWAADNDLDNPVVFKSRVK